MALARIVLKPGVDKQNTEYGAEGGWIDSDYVRFRYGLPEKMGGWTQFNESAAYLVGMTSEIYTWNGLDGAPYMIVGTNRNCMPCTALCGETSPLFAEQQLASPLTQSIRYHGHSK
jgi:hypothetical protein